MAFSEAQFAPAGTQAPLFNNRPLRLDTLVRLRWLAIAGQTISVFFVAFVLRFEVRLFEGLSLILLSVLLNLGLMIRFGQGHRLSVNFATAQLIFDSLQLGGLLYLTGGLQNPFSLLLLAPVSVSATALPQRITFLLAAIACGLVTILALGSMPLPWFPDDPMELDRLYVTGAWAALICGIIFVAAYTNRVAHEARQLADALTATELALTRQQHLRALDGLAAAAAHELGTPLATIALAAKEMRNDVGPGALADDVDLIVEQAQRCRIILGKLRNLSTEAAEPFQALPLHDIIAEAALPHEARGKLITLTSKQDPGSEPIFPRQVGLLYGLGNLIENAAHYARREVVVDAGWDATAIKVTITDDGPGFSPEVIDRLGDPYLTTRGVNSASSAGGLGLGVFIAKTLLERTGARIEFDNASNDGHARVTITWPRGAAPIHRK